MLIRPEDRALLTDLYQFTMVQAYLREGLTDTAVFSLFSRRLGDRRNLLIAAGLDDALDHLEHARFSDEDLDFLDATGTFTRDTLDWLQAFRFSGQVRAMPEGTPFFADEPVLEVAAPLPEAQLVETFLLNQVNLQCTIASKAFRVRTAAGSRTVVDFGLRRTHGVDAGLKAARAAWIAGIDATSNVLAGRLYDMPIAGTMAHSYVEAHDDEMHAFEAFARAFPRSVLLVDTYDTLEGVRKVCRLAESSDDVSIRAVRLDSGDLAALATDARRILDEAGLAHVEIFASGGLDEHEIASLADAPIDGFGVGTKLGVSADAPSLDTVYKLAAYAGRPRLKLSTSKVTLPGRKQVFRAGEGTPDMHDVIGLDGEALEGSPLLVPVMEGGRRVEAGREPLEAARARVARARETLPGRLLGLHGANPPYEVRISDGLRDAQASAADAATSHGRGWPPHRAPSNA